MVYSQDLEKQVVGGLLKYQDVYPEVGSFLSEDDFAHDLNKTIFTLIKHALDNRQAIDKGILIARLKNLGIQFRDNVDPTDYVSALSLVQVTPKSVVQAVKDLKTVTCKRNFVEVCDKIKKQMLRGGNMSYDEVINFVDKELYQHMNSWYSAGDAVDLFETMYDRVEALGNNPVDDMGLQTPYPFYNSRYGGFRNGNVYVFAARPKQGKAEKNGSLIPTPKGFMKIEDLKIGDEVFAFDGTITKVVGKASWTNRPIYKVTSKDGAEAYVDAEHEWVVKRRHDYKWETLTTKQVAENPLKEKRRCKLPMQSALQLPKKDLPIDPYIFGVWLGDGHTGAAGMTGIDEFIISKWKSYGASLGLRCRNDAISYFLTRVKGGVENAFLHSLEGLGVRDNKHIPIEYLRASYEQRVALLQGLVDTDGHIQKDGQVEFSSSIEALAKNVRQLVLSLGIKCQIRIGKSSLYGVRKKDRYRIRFYFKRAALLPRKAKLCRNAEKKNARYIKAEYYGIGDTTCIEIDHPSKLYLTGVDFLPTHNSSFLNATAFNISNTMGKKVPALILDTEMQSEEIQERMLSSISGVPTWYITTGNWRKVPEYEKKIRAAWKLIKENKYHLYHEYVINTPIEQVRNKIKRWYYTKVGRGNQSLLVYDYIKLTGESTSEHNKEHQVIGEKVNSLKELVGKEVTAPLLTAVQINRNGVGQAGRDDSSAIALSDRVLWFASQVSIFRRKYPEEVAVETDRFGTHKLINLESRWQGKNAAGHMDYVKDLEGNLVNNFTNFTVENFKVTENADAKTMYDTLSGEAQQAERPPVANPFEGEAPKE